MSDENANTPGGSIAEVAQEQASDLAALEAMAGQGAGAVVPVGEQASQAPAGPPPVSQSAIAAASMLLMALKPLGMMAFKELKDAPDELWEPLPEGIGAVLDHFGIGESELFSSPWGRLGMACLPLVAFVSVKRMSEPDKPADPVTGTGAVQVAPALPVSNGASPGATSVSFGTVSAGG